MTYFELYQRSGQALIDFVYPPQCALTESPLELPLPDRRVLLHEDVRQELLGDSLQRCAKCALPLPVSPARQIAQVDCPHCLGLKLPFQQARTLTSYRGVARRAVLSMKHRKSAPLCRAMAELLLQKHEAWLREQEFDALTFVPMHWMRRWRRGINSPELIARHLGHAIHVSPLTLLYRPRRTTPQAGLSIAARKRNMRGAIQFRPEYQLRDAKVLLLDDVMTTMATIRMASRALRRGGAKEIAVLTVARAGNDPLQA